MSEIHNTVRNLIFQSSVRDWVDHNAFGSPLRIVSLDGVADHGVFALLAVVHHLVMNQGTPAEITRLGKAVIAEAVRRNHPAYTVPVIILRNQAPSLFA